MTSIYQGLFSTRGKTLGTRLETVYVQCWKISGTTSRTAARKFLIFAQEKFLHLAGIFVILYTTVEPYI
jgi:hypothetical protein